MPNPTDKTDPNGTLPQPELNPLLNPVLGAHMGRWAEVYFTSPPEKRDQAVLDLLRELEREPSREAEGNVGEMRQAVPPDPGPGVAQTSAAPPSEELICGSCGKSNPGDQRFCSECGSPLREGAIKSESSGPSWKGREFAAVRRSEDPALPQYWASRDDDPPMFASYQPVPYRYRLYVGAAIIIVIGALAYAIWQKGSGSSHVLPPAAPAEASTQPAAQPSPAATEGNATDNRPPEAKEPATASTAEKKAEKAEGNREGRINPEPGPAAPNREPATPASEVAATPRGNGSEELAMAENYLTGKQGRRDSSEAARWLWRAVAKESPAATVLLSDLYLRGDGVAKNCDQARLLLDAGARKGAAGAAQRIRNLQAFGCQ